MEDCDPPALMCSLVVEFAGCLAEVRASGAWTQAEHF